MSGFRTPEIPREQLVLWERRLEDALPDDHQVRHLDFLLGSAAFSETFREMERSYVLNRGKPPYRPVCLRRREGRIPMPVGRVIGLFAHEPRQEEVGHGQAKTIRGLRGVRALRACQVVLQESREGPVDQSRPVRRAS